MYFIGCLLLDFTLTIVYKYSDKVKHMSYFIGEVE